MMTCRIDGRSKSGSSSSDAGSTVIVVGSLLVIVGTVVVKSLPALRLSMLTQTPKGGYYLGKKAGSSTRSSGRSISRPGRRCWPSLLSLPIVLYLNLYAEKVFGPGHVHPLFARRPLGHSLDRLRGVRVHRHDVPRAAGLAARRHHRRSRCSSSRSWPGPWTRSSGSSPRP